jgi:glycosyltransferase involved in cell wall biosynthesis
MIDDKFHTVHITTVDISLAMLLKSRLLKLRSKGFKISTVSAPGTFVKDLLRSNIPHIPIHHLSRTWNIFYDIIAFYELYCLFRRGNFDIVNTYSPKAGVLGRLAARLAGVPIIIHTSWGLMFNENMNFLKKYLYITIYKIAAACCDHILSVNIDDIELMKKYRIAHNKVSYLGNATQLDLYSPDKIDLIRIKNLKDKYRIPPEWLVIGIIGRLVKEKGYIEFIEAAKRIKAKYNNVIFIAVGPLDPIKRDCISYDEIKSLEKKNIIKFLGFQNDMVLIYGLIDIVVLPSHREGFPRVLVEAAAMKKPIITTNTRGCKEAVEEGRNGLLVPVNNSIELADAIEKLIKDKQLRTEFGTNSRRKAEQEFDENNLVEKIIRVYNKLLKQKFHIKQKQPQ